MKAQIIELFRDLEFQIEIKRLQGKFEISKKWGWNRQITDESPKYRVISRSRDAKSKSSNYKENLRFRKNGVEIDK